MTDFNSLCQLLLFCSLFGLAGCPVPADGTPDDSDAGEAESLSPGLANSCANTPCDEGGACVGLDPLPDADSEGPACFTVCELEGASCVTASHRTGACTALEDARLVCLATSVNLDGCGNRANAICEDGALCAVFPDLGGVRTCVRPCDPADPATCRADVEGCGCIGDEVCTSFARLQSGDNVCAPSTGPGATCGVEGNGDVHPCNSGSRCLVQGAPYPGACE